MAHEAKLGLVFIGILLTVFGALLIKRLSRHGPLPGMNINGAGVKSGDGAALAHIQPQPAPSTLVKPLNDGSVPPDIAAREHAAEKQNSPWTWNHHDSEHSSVAKNITAPPSNEQPPSLLAEPLNVGDVGNRYASAHTSDVDPPSAGASSQSVTNYRSKESSSEGALANASTPVPYRSGYSTPNDDTTASHPSTAQQPANSTVDPFAHAESTTAASPIPPVTSTTTPTPMPAAPRTNPFATNSSSTTANPIVNDLRAIPGNYSAGSSSSVVAASDNGYRSTSSTITPSANNFASKTTSQSQISNYDFPSRAAVNNDFPTRTTTSGVITASTMPPTGIQRNGDQYTVQPGDSFWIISQKAYGSGGFFKALLELNRKRTKDLEDLKVGEVLTVPDESVIRRMYPDLCPKPRKAVTPTQQRMISASARLQGAGRIYTVVDGDTLFEIARHELGKPARWAEIYDLNRDVLGDDFDYLRPGTELILPDHPGGSSSDAHNNTATRPAESLYPR
jgi:LysM repeat protein